MQPRAAVGPQLVSPPYTPAAIEPVAIVAQGLACAAGIGLQALADAVRDDRSALQAAQDPRVDWPTWLGRVDAVEHCALPAALQPWDCRATRLAWLGLQADGFMAAVSTAVARHGTARVGVVLGTSASTIGASEGAYRRLTVDGGFPPALRKDGLNTIHALATFVQAALRLRGPCATVSTACSSSAKAFAQAERWLRLELVDAVVVGGVDALCDSLLFGFHALELVSPERCRPFGAGRRGLNIGEAAGYALLQRGAGPWQLLGHGESNDAHHMSAPHPQGLGAELAVDAALARAGVQAADIEYVNLHGTATPRNDEVEAALVARRYAAGVHASASKGVTGHTMGAAGLVEALLCGLAVRDGLCSGTCGTSVVDPALTDGFAARLRLQPRQRRVRLAASHAFGFGGNNAVLVFGGGA